MQHEHFESGRPPLVLLCRRLSSLADVTFNWFHIRSLRIDKSHVPRQAKQALIYCLHVLMICTAAGSNELPRPVRSAFVPPKASRFL